MKYKIQSQVFKLAHYLNKAYKLNSISEALKIAWKGILLKKKMLEGGVHFTYITKNGFANEVFGTLRNINDKIQGSNKFQNDRINIRYYDLEKQDFRTFEIRKLISVEQF